MAKLLVVEGSTIFQSLFKKELDKSPEFDYKIVATYKEAKHLLSQTRYEFAVVERTLSDAKNGEIIALCNQHNIAPLVFTKTIDEDFFEAFEGAQIVDYIIKYEYHNIAEVMQKLKRLLANKSVTLLVVNDSHIYGSYLKQNLNLHGFKVLSASNTQDALKKLELHAEVTLAIVDNEEPYLNAFEFVQIVRSNSSLDALKILFLADESNSFETSRLLHVGADDYIVKQFSRSEFYVRVYQNIKKVGEE
jgi:DNA-binding response OmpR family regulator